MQTKIDKNTRLEIADVVRRSIAEAYTIYNEVWVTGDELCKHIGCFKRDWLKNYGSALPRTQAIVEGKDGEEHKTSWVYPLHKIQAMMADGRIKSLKVKADFVQL